MKPKSLRHIALLGGTADFNDFLYTLPRLALPLNFNSGKTIEKYENFFADLNHCKHGITFSSGRVGLFGLLKSFGIGEGDEVLLHVPSHIVVPNAIRYTGAKPVYTDCNLNDYNIDVQKAKEKITSKTKAIILQHTFGIPADISGVLKLAEENNLIVIEDCVHALGGTYEGKFLGSFGTASFFSTEETKMISTTMGGIVLTDDSTLSEKMKEFRTECAVPEFWLTYKYLLKFSLYYLLLQPYVHKYARAVYEFFGNRLPLPRPTTYDELIGEKPSKYLVRFSNVQSEIGLRQLKHLQENLTHRRKIAQLYNERLQELKLKRVIIPEHSNPSYVRYPVWVRDRKEAERRFKKYGVLGLWFTSVLEEAVDPANVGYEKGSCPNAEAASKHLINLPNHLRVSERDAVRLLSIIQDLIPSEEEFLNGNGNGVDYTENKTVGNMTVKN
jgi:perosamine synthetase